MFKITVKVKVNSEQYKALKSFGDYENQGMLGVILELILHLKMKKAFVGNRCVLNSMDLEDFINSLLNGFELE